MSLIHTRRRKMFKLVFSSALNFIGKRIPRAFSLRHFDGSVETFGAGPGLGVTITLGSPDACRRIVQNPSLGFCELYAEGKVGVEAPAGIDGLLQLLQTLYALNVQNDIPGLRTLNWLKRKFQARNNPPPQSLANVRDHYDQNDEIVRMITGATKQYSCAYFARPEWSLDQAQLGKMDYLISKLRLERNTRLLDIGCGYGGLIRRAAKKLGAKSLGVTLSREQEWEGNRLIGEENLRDLCAIRFADYRNLSGTFDRIVSVGMYEHVGAKAWKEYFKQVDSLLADNGVFVLHTICLNRPRPMDSFIRRHIFPGAELPSFAEVLGAAEGTVLQCRHFENLQTHYAKTCLAWLANLRLMRQEIIKRYGEWRYRAFEIYLTGGAASFSAAGGMQLGQFVFTKGRSDWPVTTEFMTKWLSAKP